MKKAQTITVFLGSFVGNNPAYATEIDRWGKDFAKNDITLLYGGGSVGLMGILAHSVRTSGGKVIGVIPDFLYEKEKPVDYGRLVTVSTMTERKQIFFEGRLEQGIPRPDAIVTLPGGDGTLDELFEGITLSKLNRKPYCDQPQVLCNLLGFWDPQLQQRQKMVEEGFVSENFAKKLTIVDTVDKIIPAINEALARPVPSNGVPRLIADNGNHTKAAG